jgi:hypothetical protein
VRSSPEWSNYSPRELAALELKQRRHLNPLDYFTPSPGQMPFFRGRERFKMLRGPNQAGKTMAGAAELIYRMIGAHPYQKVSPAGGHFRVITYSWDQSRTVSRKIWELMPKELLHPETKYHPDRGFMYHQFRLTNGSFCEIYTTKQGALANASATLDGVWIDEPPPIELWSELCARIMAKRGSLWLTMTPIGRPCGWLQQKCEAGEIADYRFSLTPENCPWYTAEQIAEIEKMYLPFEVPQRIHGSWAGYLRERVFKGFDDSCVRDEVPIGETLIAIGLDHGSGAGSQVALLLAVGQGEKGSKVWVLDEAWADESTTPEEDARSILRMLERNKMTIEHVDRWTGDIDHGGRRWGGRKSNRLLENAFERSLRVGINRLPFKIRTAKKGRGSVWYGARVLHSAMLRGDFCIRPRCKKTIESLQNWNGSQAADCEEKHAVDALRYGVVEMMQRAYNPSSVKIY